MTIITTRLTVSPDGSVSVSDILPTGEHIVRVEIIKKGDTQPETEPFDVNKLPKLDLGPWPWPEGTTFSREEMYGDDGR